MRKEILGWVSIKPDSESDKWVTENYGKGNVACLASGPPEVHKSKHFKKKKPSKINAFQNHRGEVRVIKL